jgi:hypothetical protein
VGLVLVLGCAWAITQSSHAQQETDQPADRAMWAALAHGDRAGAERLASERPEDPTALAVRARLLASIVATTPRPSPCSSRSRRPSRSATPRSSWGCSTSAWGGGRMPSRVLSTLYSRASSGDPGMALRAGRAAQALNRPREANSLFRVASNLPPSPAPKRHGARSSWSGMTRRGCPVVPERAEDGRAVGAGARRAWVGRSPTTTRRRLPPRPPSARWRSTRTWPTRTSCSPNSTSNNTKWTRRARASTTVLEFNPSHLEARSLLGRRRVRARRSAAFEPRWRGSSRSIPSYADVYRVAGALAARHYRFEEAVALTRQRLALDPDHTPEPRRASACT